MRVADGVAVPVKSSDPLIVLSDTVTVERVFSGTIVAVARRVSVRVSCDENVLVFVVSSVKLIDRLTVIVEVTVADVELVAVNSSVSLCVLVLDHEGVREYVALSLVRWLAEMVAVSE